MNNFSQIALETYVVALIRILGHEIRDKEQSIAILDGKKSLDSGGI